MVMRMFASTTDRAVLELEQALSEVSTVKLKEIRHRPAKGSEPELMAYLEVVGHPHALACKVNANSRGQNLRSMIEELRESAHGVCENAAPVLIASYLSPQEQEMCKECGAGFLDFEGNARIALGEVFIVKRTMHLQVQEGALNAALLQKTITRPTTPAVYIASNVAGGPNRVRKGTIAGVVTA
jgi:hypothetical protein